MRITKLVAVGLLSLMCLSPAKSQDADEVPATTEASSQPSLASLPEALSNVDPNPIIERSSHTHVHVQPHFKGFWAKKFAWRPRWVKTWQEKKVYVAVWKRMWGPIVTKEWVPVPKPPPGWVKHDAGSYIVKTFPHH